MGQTRPYGEGKYDEIDIEPTIDVAAAPPSASSEPAEDQDSSVHNDRPMGCYYTPGKIIFYVKLTDVIVEEPKAEEKIEKTDPDEVVGFNIIDQNAQSVGDVEYDDIEIEADDTFDSSENSGFFEEDSGFFETTGEFEASQSGEFDAGLSGEFPVPNEMPLASVDQMLAEISFIEGHESLARGDRTGAIWHYNNAISYAPDRVEFFLKLAEVLSEDPDTWVKAERILIKAIKISPDDVELRTRLDELRKQRKERHYLRKQRRAKRKASSARKNGTHSSSDKAKSSAAPGAECEPGDLIKQLAELEVKATADLMKKVRKRRLISRRVHQRSFLPADRMLPDRLPRRRWMVLVLVLIAALIGTDYVLSYRGDLVPVLPATGSAMAAQDVKFEWDCDRADLVYIIEVYDRGEMVMWQITREKSYTPDLNQKTVFEAEHTYSWIVRAGPSLKQGYKYITESQSFYITKAVEPPPAPIAQPVKPVATPVQQQPPKVITPLPPNQTKRID
jgi:hypothetical protein